MLEPVIRLIKLTYSAPKDGMREFASYDFSWNILWTMMAAVAAVSGLLSEVSKYILLARQPEVKLLIDLPPISFAAISFVMLVITAYSTKYAGQMFGGDGTLANSMKAIIWLNVALLPLQLVQVVLFLALPVLGALVGYGSAMFGLWLFVNFVAAIHNFDSLGAVFAGIFVSAIGILFGLAIMLSLIFSLLGLEPPNAS